MKNEGTRSNYTKRCFMLQKVFYEEPSFVECQAIVAHRYPISDILVVMFARR